MDRVWSGDRACGRHRELYHCARISGIFRCALHFLGLRRLPRWKSILTAWLAAIILSKTTTIFISGCVSIARKTCSSCKFDIDVDAASTSVATSFYTIIIR